MSFWMMPRFSVLLACALLAAVDGRARGTEARTEVGECAKPGATLASQFDPALRIGSLPSPEVVQAEASVNAADLISIQYAPNFKIVTEKFSKEQYILTQCGTTKPSDAEVDSIAPLGTNYTRKFFTIPLQSVMAESTVGLSFLAALGVQDRVTHVSQYASGPCWQKAMACGAVTTSATSEQRQEVDAIFMDCSWDGSCGNVNALSNAIHISASQDPGPLHSAEHVKFVAAFFNKESMAKTHFSAAVTVYTSTSPSSVAKPVVAWIGYNAKSSWSAESFTISMATYKMHYVNAAGGKNIDRTAAVAALGDKVSAAEAPAGWTLTVATSNFANKAEAASALWAALAGVDAVVDETYEPNPSIYTYASFLQNFNLTEASSLKFVQNKRVFRIDGTHTPAPNYGLDWFESRIAHPEWAVEGLARVLHKDITKRSKYFRNVAEGQMPELLSESSCGKEQLPQCSNSTFPEHIPTMSPAQPESTTSAPASKVAAVPSATSTVAPISEDAGESASDADSLPFVMPLLIGIAAVAL